ncbi:MAG: glycosyltransferase family 9 protein [Desulfobacterales bacterium]
MPEKRLLIIHQGALGDFVVTFPVLKALAAVYPGIDGICRSSFGRLAIDLGVLQAAFALESARFASLYTDRSEPAVDTLISAYGSRLLFSFSEVLEKSVAKIAGGRVFRVQPWPRTTDRCHITTFLSRQVLACGLLKGDARRRFARALSDLKTAAGGKRRPGNRVLVAPGAGSVKKRWPLADFMRVAAELKERGLDPSILLGPAEEDLAAELKKSPEWHSPIVKPATFQILIGVLESAAGYIGNDSGVSHLAAFMGLPALVIFGPSDPVRWRPFGDHVRLVRATMPCSPCFGTDDKACRQEGACLAEITPDRVLAAFEKTLANAAQNRKETLDPARK